MLKLLILGYEKESKERFEKEENLSRERNEMEVIWVERWRDPDGYLHLLSPPKDNYGEKRFGSQKR